MERVLLKDLADFVKEVLARLPRHNNRASVVGLSGELGAGKTTFVQTLAKELGIGETVQSPTYVLMKSYAISSHYYTRLVHIDAYRLSNANEFAALKPEQFLNDPHVLVCVEWPEKVDGALPTPDLRLKFSSDGATDAERYIEVL
jgi:tRNA threonylcarbamoyladenosine biosynthesis protein TsaE